jgi:chromosome segregation ATPase
VGRNGSGKSNLIDAVLWTLGDPRFDTVPGGELIFAGSAHHPPSDVALAGLTIDASADGHPSEVTVGRRVLRSGQSEFHINDRACEAYEVRALAAELGIGKAVVRQGDLESIVTASPVARRAWFEEAAGVSDYRRRWDAAKIELAVVEKQLERATVVAGEVDEAARALERVVASAPDNSVAVAEHDRFVARQSQLRADIADLQSQRDHRLGAVWENEVGITSDFARTFEAVNAYFAEIFPGLLEGWTARLCLSDPDDLANSGIELHMAINDQPLSDTRLLSGGQKALTALGLNLALFKTCPRPLYLLDEVDAALDEANVAMVISLFKELSQQGQLVIVTHNRRTQEAAEVLWGLLMRPDGVSKPRYHFEPQSKLLFRFSVWEQQPYIDHFWSQIAEL